ncbi:Polysaccharide biosynthesis protein [Mycobacteroides abscessus subsp. abscessus]|nr:Polysaccharide biosynthesis protein [Mycobacteroides abscessus subsp. abscessus]
MTREKTLVKNTIIFTIGNFASKMLGFILIPFYTHYLTPSEYGYYDLIVSSFSLLVPLISFQITDALYRHLLDANTLYNKKKIISISFFLILINVLLTNILYLYLMTFITIKYEYLILLQIDLSIFALFWAEAARGMRHNVEYSISGVLATLVMLTSNIALILLTSLRVDALILSSIFSNLILIGYLEYKLKLRKYISPWSLDKSLGSLLLKYSLPLIPNALSWWFMNLSDRLIINYYLGTNANGIYAVANKFPTMLVMVYSMFNLAWQESSISEYRSQDRNDFYSRMFNKLLVLQFTAVLVLLTLTKDGIALFVDIKFSEAWIYIPSLYIGALFASFSSFYGTGYLSTKNTIGAFYTSVLGAMVNILVNFMFTPIIGIHAASISTMLAFFVMWIARVYQTKKYFKIVIKPSNIIILGCFVVLYTVLYYVNKTNVQTFLLFVLSVLLFLIFNRDLFIKIVIRKFKKMGPSNE